MSLKLELECTVAFVTFLFLHLPALTVSEETQNYFPVLKSLNDNRTVTVIEKLVDPVGKYLNTTITRHASNLLHSDSLEDAAVKYRRYHNKDQDFLYDDGAFYPRPHGRRGGRGYGGSGSFAFASAGGGGWAAAGGGNAGGAGYGTRGKGWNPRKGSSGGDGVPNNHYNPSVNKYGGGGPLSFVPGKGFNHGGKGGAGTSSSASANAGGGGITPILPPQAEVTVHIVTCEVSDKCQNFVHCASHAYAYLHDQDRCCVIRQQQNNKGLCCSGHSASPPQGNPTGRHFNPYATDKVSVPDISESSLATAASKGYEYKEKYQKTEDRLLELNIVVERGTAAYGHLQFFQVYF